jgi:predicted ribosomally synthesized peptide with SipW-like signal peptide
VSRTRWLLGGVAAFGAGALLTTGTGHTFASFSDYKVFHAAAQAGTWGPPTPVAPDECGRTADQFNVVVVPAGQTSYTGTNKDDLIFANDLGDTIDGGNGDDCIVGGAGDDVLSGGNGKDVIIGGPGNDTINGDNGPDIGLYGGPGDDVINGDNGPDVVDGGDGDDHCNGGRAPEQLVSCEHTS